MGKPHHQLKLEGEHQVLMLGSGDAPNYLNLLPEASLPIPTKLCNRSIGKLIVTSNKINFSKPANSLPVSLNFLVYVNIQKLQQIHLYL